MSRVYSKGWVTRFADSTRIPRQTQHQVPSSFGQRYLNHAYRATVCYRARPGRPELLATYLDTATDPNPPASVFCRSVAPHLSAIKSKDVEHRDVLQGVDIPNHRQISRRKTTNQQLSNQSINASTSRSTNQSITKAIPFNQKPIVHALSETNHQPCHQAPKQSINQQSIGRLINQSRNQSIHHATHQPTNQSQANCPSAKKNNHSSYQSTNKPTQRPLNQPTNKSINQLINHSTSQTINQTIK